jgi:uncharacterized protein YegP (UPF0339 family)
MTKERKNTPTIVVKSASKNQIRLVIKAGNGETLNSSQALDSLENAVNNLEALVYALKNGEMKFSRRGISDEMKAKFNEVLSHFR